METVGLLVSTFTALSVVFLVLLVIMFLVVVGSRFLLCCMPRKMVTVYTKDGNGNIVKYKLEESIADRLWGSNGKS